MITGITGQDGSYLAELLLAKGYEVHGLIRRSSSFNTSRINHLYKDPHEKDNNLHLHYGDITDGVGLSNLVRQLEPQEIYNLAAQSHVKVSFEMPDFTAQVSAVGTIRLLEAIRSSKIKTRFYQASTSELYGKVQAVPQNETTPFYPRSPYGVAKIYAYWITVNYREAYGMFASNGILFNHESPLRGETFVTRKITRAAAKIALGLQDCLYLGNLDAQRDWGHAKDYVEGMWRILQHHEADDFVLATGVTTRIREMVRMSFAELGIQLNFSGSGEKEIGIVDSCIGDYQLTKGQVVVRIDPKYFRPTEVDLLIGDASKAKEKLGWEPTYTLEQMVSEMVASDLNLFKRDAFLRSKGYSTGNQYE